MSIQLFPVRAELVEAPFSTVGHLAGGGLPFDRLRANGGSVQEVLA